MNTVEPIRNKKTLNKIKEILSKNKRDFLIFSVGKNSSLKNTEFLTINIKEEKKKKKY